MANIIKLSESLIYPKIPKDWNPEKSIAYLKPLLENWKKDTIAIAKELYIANQIYSNQGRRTDLRQGLPEVATWEQYCNAIGLPKRTANYWIASVYGPQRLPSPELPKLESQVIYADPPWSFSNSGFDQSSAQQYPTLTLDEICNFTDSQGKTIRKLANKKQSVLFLWVPEALVPEGLEVVKAWDFQYKAQMIWVKDKSPGMGWWVNSKHELLFIASNGEGLHPAIKYDSVFEEPVLKHSQKPEIVYEMIEQMYIGPYIELFARQKRKGWISWGNEISENY